MIPLLKKNPIKKLFGTKRKQRNLNTRRENLAEREIVETIRQHLEVMPDLPVPFGDDVSGFSLDEGKMFVAKTDMLVGITDVPKGMSLFQAARKAIVMNVSDFAAKGIQPIAALVSLGLPKRVKRPDVISIAKGLNAGAREYGFYVIGGDTGEASDLVINVSMFGLGERGKIPLRGGARAGDLVAVTNEFGKSAAGLELLKNKCRSSSSIRRILIDSVLCPKARLRQGIALSKTGLVTASIDSSDGLAWSLHEICRASNVGVMIDKLPLAKEAIDFAKLNKQDPIVLALYGGEEYELVVTVKPSSWRKAVESVEKASGRLLEIGKVTEKRKMILKQDSRETVIEPRGYEHFRN